MCLLVVKYSGLFKNLRSATLITAFILFILYLLLFLVVCFTYTWIPHEHTFVKKFERYLVLAIGIYMIIPFALSSILIFALLTEHLVCLQIWLKVFTAVTTVYTLIVLASSVYSLIEGTLHIGLTALIATSVLAITNIHGIMIVYSLYKEFVRQTEEMQEQSAPNFRKEFPKFERISVEQERLKKFQKLQRAAQQSEEDSVPQIQLRVKSLPDSELDMGREVEDKIDISVISKVTSNDVVQVDSICGVELRVK